MRKAFVVAVLGAFLVFAVGCVGPYNAPVRPSQGFLFTSVGAPISNNFHADTPVCRKQGSSSSISVLGIVAFGDAGLQDAARDGNLEKVHYAEYDFLNVLGIYTHFTTTVYGE